MKTEEGRSRRWGGMRTGKHSRHKPKKPPRVTFCHLIPQAGERAGEPRNKDTPGASGPPVTPNSGPLGPQSKAVSGNRCNWLRISG